MVSLPALLTGHQWFLGKKMHPLAIVTCLVIMFATGQAIRCWDCNSSTDKRCADPFDNYTTALVDCDDYADKVEHLTMPGEEAPRANLCRKTMQTVEDEVRVIRGCGWIPNIETLKHRDCFKRAGTHQVQILHCVCHDDACNSAGHSGLSLALLLLLPSVPAVLYS